MFQLASKNLASSNILIVDDDEISSTLIAAILSEVCQCFTVSNALDALDFCENNLPDLMVVDVNMPGMDGLTLCKKIKQSKATEDVPVIFITSNTGENSQNDCWQAGCSDFVPKPVIAQTLIHRVKNQLLSKLRLDAIMKMTFHDSLTGLYNRNYITQEYPILARQLNRDQQPLGLIIFDVDNFKQYNDTYGHLQGDICLARVADAMRKFGRRARDALVRFGGEEFIALLPNTSLTDTTRLANQIIQAVFNLNIPHTTSSLGRVTLSAGAVSVQNFDQYVLDEVIEQADINLYDAKLEGKNQVVAS
ncbi:GGDEF domain-containing response regulator [Alteromonas gilva]|uniref:diguanylate cyclase n=1 Tax=Alteromonas gilva TaxID=2987522 RepID=A0ABT5KYU1_9ALTE|nr:diguanylate cyclase [Alteromonas gilva]MDC8829935.1 diguanylate cyclase [Alteromonas gilva]